MNYTKIYRRNVNSRIFLLVCVLLLATANSSLPSHFLGISKIVKARAGYKDPNHVNAYNSNKPSSSDRYYDPRSNSFRDAKTGKTYDPKDHQYQYEEGDSSEAVAHYTSSIPLKLMVAAAAALGGFTLSHFIMLLILSKSLFPAIVASGVINAVFVFLSGDYSDFARSLGVFLILAIQGFTIHRFVPKFVRQLRSALSLSERRPFPPGPNNPWTYSDPVDRHRNPKDTIDFSMTKVVITLSVFGSLLGWNVVKPIPLFPSWLGAILGAVFLAYNGTFQDSRGDFIRYIGYTIASVLGEVINIADEVELRQRCSVVLGKLFFFCKGIDSQFHVIERLKYLIGEILLKFTSIIYSMKGEVLKASLNPNNYGNNNSKDRRYRPSSGQFGDEDDDGPPDRGSSTEYPAPGNRDSASGSRRNGNRRR